MTQTPVLKGLKNNGNVPKFQTLPFYFEFRYKLFGKILLKHRFKVINIVLNYIKVYNSLHIAKLGQAYFYIIVLILILCFRQR